MSKYKKVLDFLEKHNVDPEVALVTIKRRFMEPEELSETNLKRHWKMMRFTLYLWERIKEDEKGILGKRIDTVKKVVWSPKFKRLYETFPLPTFNPENEVKKLTQLIAEPRQRVCFKEKNFVYENTKKNIPQSLINKLR
jgi:hypothetical protein